MQEHYTLYYLFLEDMQHHPMPEKKNAEIKKNIENFYQNLKPPWSDVPLNSIREINPDKNQFYKHLEEPL